MAQSKENTRNIVVKSLVWAFGEHMSAQLISVIVTVILARLLDPEHYGIISIVTVCLSLMDIFVSSGFGSALIQKKEADSLDFNTAFSMSFGLSWLLYVLMYLAAPWIAVGYEMPELCAVLRVMGLRIPIAAISNIQQADLRRSMNFKRFFWVHIIAVVFSGVTGIALAKLGYGVWALVAQSLSNAAIGTIIMLFVGTWRPRLQYSWTRAKAIWSFGWKVLMTRMIATLESDIRSLIVGGVFGAADLAYYDQGKKYPSLLVMNISNTIDKVMLPVYSKEQDQVDRLLSMLRRSIRTGTYVLAPMLIGFAAVSEQFVEVFLTDKWLPCVPYMQIFCITFLTRPLESSCNQALLAIGKSGTALRAMIVINVVALCGVIISVYLFESVFAIAITSLVNTLVSVICFLVLTRRHFCYTLKMQLQDIMPSLAISVIMIVGVILAGKLNGDPLLVLGVQVLNGAIIYIGSSAVLKLEIFYYLLGMLKNTLPKRK